MIVIPAVDIKDGKAVRLRMGRADDETVYSDDPVAAALKWADAGAARVHVVDLDGAFDGMPGNIEITEAIIDALDCEVETGGGLRTPDAVERLLAAGAARVILGTVAVEDRELSLSMIRKHPGRINLGVDAKDGMVATRGWTETAAIEAVEFVKSFEGEPVAEVIFTDISRDGMLGGPNLDAMSRMAAASPFPMTASGGVGSIGDIRDLLATGSWGAIVGKALYDGRVEISEALAVGSD